VRRLELADGEKGVSNSLLRKRLIVMTQAYIERTKQVIELRDIHYGPWISQEPGPLNLMEELGKTEAFLEKVQNEEDDDGVHSL
jgi:hypothetical protein